MKESVLGSYTLLLCAAIFAAISATRPRADVAYCIHALARRLSKTHNWAVSAAQEKHLLMGMLNQSSLLKNVEMSLNNVIYITINISINT